MDTQVIIGMERWNLGDIGRGDSVNMDKILLGILSSGKPEGIKRVLVEKVANSGKQPQQSDTIKSVFKVTTEWILNGESEFEQSAGMTVFLSWAKFNRSTLSQFFNKNYLLYLLDGRFKNPGAEVTLLWESLNMLKSAETFPQLCQIVQTKSINFVRNHRQLQSMVTFSGFLLEYNDCIPQGDFTATFCSSVIYNISMFETELDNPAVFVKDVLRVSHLLRHIWHNTDVETILDSLKVIFGIISYIDDSINAIEPSFALASVVQHIPVQMINVVTDKVVSDPQILDRNMEVALMRMVGWLQWPTCNVDQWFIAFLKGLASAHKYTILINVTVSGVEQVFEKIFYPVTRDSAMTVLTHMLLSFQHSPEPFHKIADNVPDTVNHLRRENTASSQRCLDRLAELLHCLIQLHPGFPELYEPLLDSIKDYPKPSSDTVKLRLSQSRWAAQCSETTYHSRFAQRSETGKTGLVNLGNTCFMNSVLQALFMCDSFRQKVLSEPLTNPANLIMRLQQVFAFLSLTQRAAYAPSLFLKASRPPWFLPRHQQDCSEFLKYLLDQLHEDEIKRRSHTNSSPMVTAGELNPGENEHNAKQSQSANSANFVSHHGRSDERAPTTIESTFGGSLKITYRCLNCKTESSRTERFIDLPLAFPDTKFGHGTLGKKQKSSLAGGGGNDVKGIASQIEDEGDIADATLEDLIDFFLRPEKLEGQNRYHCDHCGSLQDAQRTQKILETPEYLIFSLLRFSYDAKTQSRSKIFTDIRYPKVLQLKTSSNGNHSPSAKSKLASIFKKSPSPKAKSQQKAGKKTDVYGLNGVIVHSGLSSECGHYYCYARHTMPVNHDQISLETSSSDTSSETDLLQDKWYLLNDGRVTYSSYESFSNVTKRFGKDTAYVLFYKKMGASDVSNGSVGQNESICVSAVDPPVRADLREAVAKDNELYIQEQELEARVQAKRKRSMNPPHSPSWFNYQDPDDKGGPPGSCGGGGGSGLGGLDTSGSRFIY